MMDMSWNKDNHSREDCNFLPEKTTPFRPNCVYRFKKKSQKKLCPSIDDFILIKPISRGAFGKVFLGHKKDKTDKIYAIKIMRKEVMIDKNMVNQVRAERDALALSKSPWVVRLYYSFLSISNIYLVMEYMIGGDVKSLLLMYGYFDENMALMYTSEVVLALEYLHNHGIIHRDLKPDNMLISGCGHIKLTDFGLSKINLNRQINISDILNTPGISKHLPEDYLRTPGQIVSLTSSLAFSSYVEDSTAKIPDRQEYTWMKRLRAGSSAAPIENITLSLQQDLVSPKDFSMESLHSLKSASPMKHTDFQSIDMITELDHKKCSPLQNKSEPLIELSFCKRLNCESLGEIFSAKKIKKQFGHRDTSYSKKKFRIKFSDTDNGDKNNISTDMIMDIPRGKTDQSTSSSQSTDSTKSSNESLGSSKELYIPNRLTKRSFASFSENYDQKNSSQISLAKDFDKKLFCSTGKKPKRPKLNLDETDNPHYIVLRELCPENFELNCSNEVTDKKDDSKWNFENSKEFYLTNNMKLIEPFHSNVDSIEILRQKSDLVDSFEKNDVFCHSGPEELMFDMTNEDGAENKFHYQGNLASSRTAIPLLLAPQSFKDKSENHVHEDSQSEAMLISLPHLEPSLDCISMSTSDHNSITELQKRIDICNSLEKTVKEKLDHESTKQSSDTNKENLFHCWQHVSESKGGLHAKKNRRFSDSPKHMPKPFRTPKSVRRGARLQLTEDGRILGTPDYLAPELLLGKKHGAAVDWWALGVCLFEFLTGIPPFTDETPELVFQNILKRDLQWPEEEDAISPHAQNAIDYLLTFDPDKRPSAKDLKKHKFFNEIDWDHLLEKQPPFIPQPDNSTDTSYFTARNEMQQLKMSAVEL